MTKLFNKLFRKEEVIDQEKVKDQLRLSVETSRFDKSLFLSLTHNPMLVDSYLKFLEASLHIAIEEKHDLVAEINKLQTYVDLYKEAHLDSFYCKIEYKVPDAELDFKIEPFILFPLIQNAFHYGYNSMEKYPVKIRIRIVASQLKVEVSNRVNHYVLSQEENDELRWFKARLNELYSEKYSLIFNSNSNLFKATLVLDLA